MKKNLMRKMLATILCAVMLLGCMAVVASAVETGDAPSGSGYKEQFISALLESEDKWLEDTVEKIMFVDIDLDGLPDLVAQDFTPTSHYVFARAYYYDNEILPLKTENSSNYFSTRDLALYYDKSTYKYCMYGKIYGRDGMDDNGLYNFNQKNIEFTVNGSHSIISTVYSSFTYKNVPSDSEEKTDIQYYGVSAITNLGKKITETEYNSINISKFSNMVDANLNYGNIGVESYEKLSPTDKRATLEKLYDSFTYDKFETEDNGTDSVTDSDIDNKSYRDKFISALLESEAEWIDNSEAIHSEIQFIDLNFDGVSELLVQYYGNGLSHGSEVYSLVENKVQKLKNSQDLVVQAEGLNGYFDSTSKAYRMFGFCYRGTMWEGEAYNYELKYSSNEISYTTLITTHYEKDSDQGVDNITYYSSNDEIISEVEYNRENAKILDNLVNVNIKYEKIDRREYVVFSFAEKKAVLEKLYDSFSYDKYDASVTTKVEISGFSLDYGIGCGQSVDLYVYMKYGANAEQIINPNIVYNSSNESVATVKSGENGSAVVTGVSGGTAKLTATETTTGVTATCDVFVYNGSKFDCSNDSYNFKHTNSSFFSGDALNELSKAQSIMRDNKREFGDFWYELGWFNDDICYQISNKVFNRLLEHSVNHSEKQRIKDSQNDVWGGSCYGMSNVLDILYADRPAISLSKLFNNDYEKPSDLPVPVNSSEMQDLINYYQLTQNFYYYDNIRLQQAKEIESNYSDAIKKFINNINDTSTPVSVGIKVAERDSSGKVKYKSGHQILLLRIKSETNDYYVIECYDINAINKYSDLRLYKTAGNFYPYVFNISYGRYNVLNMYMSNVDTIDKFNFFSTRKKDSEQLANDKVSLSGHNNFTLSANGKTLIDGGQSTYVAVLGPIPTGVFETVDSDVDSISEMTYFIDKGISSEYTVNCKDSAHYGNTEITCGDHTFSITTKDSGTAKFNDGTGEVNVSMDEKCDYKVRITDNDNICNWDWFTLTVKADNSQQLDVSFTSDGVLINGDNLKGTEIIVNNESNDVALTIDKNLTNVMIKKSNYKITAEEVNQRSNNSLKVATSQTTSTKSSANQVTTGDITKISIIFIIFSVSIIVMTLSIKRRKNN